MQPGSNWTALLNFETGGVLADTLLAVVERKSSRGKVLKGGTRATDSVDRAGKSSWILVVTGSEI